MVSSGPSQLVTACKVLRVANGLTVTVIVVDLLHVGPLVAVPVIVYVVVTGGLALTVAPVVEDNPIDGLQVYVYETPLEADNVVLSPTHIILEVIPGVILAESATAVDGLCLCVVEFSNEGTLQPPD